MYYCLVMSSMKSPGGKFARIHIKNEEEPIRNRCTLVLSGSLSNISWHRYGDQGGVYM